MVATTPEKTLDGQINFNILSKIFRTSKPFPIDFSSNFSPGNTREKKKKEKEKKREKEKERKGERERDTEALLTLHGLQ